MVSINTITTKISNTIAAPIVKRCPKIVVESKKVNDTIAWIGENMSSPENRLFLGITALMSQPFIDLHNKRVDEDTRKVSAARTVAKIIAGTLTGVAIRYGCIKALGAFCKLPSEITPNMRFKKFRTLFTPQDALDGKLTDLTNYKNAYGTVISLFVMLFTNFLIDAPLTKFLTNKFIDKYHLNVNKLPTNKKPTPEQKEGKEAVNG